MRKCTNSNTVHEVIHNCNVTESHNTEFDDSNSVDIADNQQELDSAETEFRDNAHLPNEFDKKTFTSTFKTALEIRNEEKLQAAAPVKNKDIQSKKLVKDIEISQIKSQTSITNDFNTTQKNIHKADASQIQISNGFVCAREIHESNTCVLKPNASSSKLKDRKSKVDKSIKKTGKSVYEQILASARSSSKTRNEDSSFSSETKSKIIDDNNVGSIKNKNETESKSKNKRNRESTECQEDDIRPVEKKRTGHSESKNKIDNYVSDQNIVDKKDKKIVNDKVDSRLEGIRNDTGGTDVVKKDKVKKHPEKETNLELKEKKESTHSIHSKHHKSDRLKVPADKAMQFKTAEILKSYLMKYYPSERLPDRATFSKTCREMHYNMLRKKIFGKKILCVYIYIYMCLYLYKRSYF